MPITYDDLAALLDQEIEVDTTEGTRRLLLVEATPHPSGHPGGTLRFTGDAAEPLGQGTYPIRAAEHADLLFIVPIAERDGHRHYEAVFA